MSSDKFYKEIAAAILTGGKNKRMGGKNKAFIRIEGIPIIRRSLSLLKEMFEEIFLVTNSSADYLSYAKDASIITDVVKDVGPLGGIHAALSATSKKAVFFVAGDMPFLHIALIRRLIERARDRDCDCVIPRSPRGAEPLYGLYSKRMLPLVETFLKEGKRSAQGLLARCKCAYVEAASDELSAFVNVNTPGEMREIKEK